MRNAFRYQLLVALLLSSLAAPATLAPTALAQTAPAASTSEAPAAAPNVPTSQSTPRHVLTAFLDRMQRDDKAAAAKLLDLSELSPEAVAARGPDLAYQLYLTMQRVVDLHIGKMWEEFEQEVAFAEAPNDANYPGRWALSQFSDDAGKEASQIKIARGEAGHWQFSAETVAQIESLFEATKELPRRQPLSEQDAEPSVPFSIWYRDLFPQWMQKTIWIMPSYQWLSLLIATLLGLITKRLSRRLLTWFSDKLLHRYDPDYTGTTAAVWKPFGRLITTAILYTVARLIGLPLSIIDFLLIILNIVTITSAVWFLYRLADLVRDYLTRRAKRQKSRSDQLVIPLGTTVVKVLGTIAGLLVMTATFKPELISTVIGGLGIGGIAIALASQETLSNFFGSLAVLFDQPFVVGDWVIVDGVEGEVESVGFRSTRIRTSLSSQVSIPNSKLASSNVDNLGRRKYRRYTTRIGVEYDTSTEQIEAFCEGIHELIRRQPHTRKNFYAANFNDFGDSALEILLVCYFETPDWATELRERHRLLLDIVRLAKKLDIAFAFPTQTVHMYQEQATKSPASINDPLATGKQSAATIAGELLNYQDRPMPVRFPGPSQASSTKSSPEGE